MPKLNLGAGATPLPDYENLDRKTGQECYPLAGYADASCETVRASHILEHFPSRQAIEVLREWVRVLKPGGVLKVAVPDFDRLVDEVQAGNPNNWPIHSFIYGGQTDENDFHKSGYNAEWLTALIEKAGLIDIKPWVSEIADCAAMPISLNLQGTKPAQPLAEPAPQIPRTASVMTLPRLAWTCNMFSALEVAVARHLKFDKVEGVFWEQCLTRGLEAHLNNGTEWILVSDYDSVYKVEQFDALCRLMLKYPDAGAICPLQIKRDDGTPLFVPLDDNGEPFKAGATCQVSDFNAEVTRAAWGHFGLTLIRVEALRRMKRPWFASAPAPDGTWNDGRTDPDMYFWKNFAASGNKLYIATHIPLAHAQVMYTVPGQDFKAMHVYPNDYNLKGLPEGVRR